MEVYGTVTSLHTLKHSLGTELLITGFLGSVKPGTTIKTTMVRHYPARSNQQLKMVFGLLLNTIKSTFDDRGWDVALLFNDEDIPSGLPVEVDDIKRKLYLCCGNVGPEGKHKTLGRHRGEEPMNVEEAARFFEKCRTWAAGKWQIQIPDPDPNWKDNTDE